MKLILLIVLGVILVSLFSALIYLFKDTGTEESSDRTLKALTWRISLSVVLFALLMGAYWAGLISPHGIE
jgi:hypothetical protein